MGVVLSCPTNVTAGSALTVTVKLYNYDCTNSISVNRLMMQLMGNSSGTLMGLGIWGPYNKWITAKTVSQATCDEYGNVTPGGPVSFSLAIMSQTPTSLSGKMSEVTVDAITSKGESLGSGSCFVNVSGAQ